MPGRIFFLLVPALLFSACGARHQVHLDRPVAPSVELSSVPFVPQDDSYCGPSALAMAAGYWRERNASMEPFDYPELVRKTYLPGRKGSLELEMAAAARSLGLIVLELSRPEAPFPWLDAGVPVIVLLDMSAGTAPVWHYAVAVGYDLERGEMLLRSGEEARQPMGFSRFYAHFRPGGHRALVLFPADRVPGPAEEGPFLRAAFALEETGGEAYAKRAYTAAAKRWPDSPRPLLAAGNLRLARGDASGAEPFYRKALDLDPDHPVALNNLAESLRLQGRTQEALTVIQEALAKGNREYRPIFYRTRKSIIGF